MPAGKSDHERATRGKSMTRHRCAAALRGRKALAWALLCFVAGQVALAAYLYRYHPEVIDPDHNARLQRLQARHAEAPDKPLILILGSSRAANGFRPDLIASAADHEMVVFNFASLGCGPVREWLTLRRLLTCGVKPQLLLVETWPLFWPQTGFFSEEPFLLVTDVYASDLGILGSLYGKRWEALSKLFQERVTPAIHYRAHALHAAAHWLLPRDGCPELLLGHLGYKGLDDHGWLPGFSGPGVQAAAQAEHDARIAQPILGHFAIDPHTDRAIRGLLADCRTHGVPIAFVFLPESSPLRTWYPPWVRAAVADYLSHLEHDFGAPVFDLRESVPDDGFADYCHLSPHGAEVFTVRFDREVLRPLLGATLSAHSIAPGAGLE
jgi:hypothetical protein